MSTSTPSAPHGTASLDSTNVDPRMLAEGALPLAMLERIGEVLVVDDEPVMVMIMTRILEKLGIIQVDTAPDPLVALQKLKDRRFGLIISDIQMEPLSGLDLYRGAKTTENAKTPFLLTTGTYGAKLAVDARTVGAKWFILKPFSVDQMRRKLREMIQA